MKWLLLLIITIITPSYLSAKESIKMELSKVMADIPDEWKVIEVKPKDSEEIWFFRKNIGAQKIKANKNLAILVYFTIKFESRVSSGLPSKADTKKLYDFENEIIPKIEKEGLCIQVASVMKGGIKDHLFYVSDPDLFLKTISEFKDKLEGFLISIEKHEDPNWEIYTEFPDGS